MTFPVSGVEVSPLVPLLAGLAVSLVTSMGGVSGGFLLLPFQVSVLGFTSPAASPTSLVYNLVAAFITLIAGVIFYRLAAVRYADTGPARNAISVESCRPGCPSPAP